MKLSDSLKFWLVFSCILIAAFLGGILGNWVFIYLLDKYYAVPGGNYLAATSSSSPVVVRDAKKVIVEQDNRIAQAVAAADLGFVKIFKRQSPLAIYQPKDALTTAAVMTSDGWLITPTQLSTTKNGSWQDYEAVGADRKRYTIEKIISDPISGISFVHLTGAQNLPVRAFIAAKELSIGQTLIVLSFDGAVELGRLSRTNVLIHSSETTPTLLTVSEFSGNDSYLFDASGQMAGVAHGRTVVAIDSIETVLEKLLTEGRIKHARLGIHYLDLSHALAPNSELGALLSSGAKDEPAVVPNSPADKAGLKAGDIIITVDDVAVNDSNSLSSLIEQYNAGDTIALTILRGKDTKNISVVLDELPLK